MRNIIKSYLSVTKKEWNGLVVLIALIAAVLFAPTIYQALFPYKPLDMNGFDAAATKLKQVGASSGGGLGGSSSVLFIFNPNNLPADKWLKLGLGQHQVQVIKNYEAKGGRFYSKGDLKKIYSITPEDYKRLEPYIDLPEKSSFAAKSDDVVEINTADSAKLTGIRGIGGGFAKSIIRYRDRLGGFYRKEQLKEVFGIDSLMYLEIAPYIKVDARKVSKINLNKATVNSLLVFPYLTYKQKNAIVEYHSQHGDYNMLADLKNIPIIDDGILLKIEPYISFK
jgi:DNA uptake protein ComE-like DNA-binding protein